MVFSRIRFFLYGIRVSLAIVLLASLVQAVELPRRSKEFVLELPNGAGKALLSEKRKSAKCTIVAFVQTTCVHCQRLASTLQRLRTEYKAKGLETVIVAYDPGASTGARRFQQLYCPEIPVYVSNREVVHPYLQVPIDGLSYVPKMLVIDRAGMIREQYDGDDKYFLAAAEEGNLRRSIEKQLR